MLRERLNINHFDIFTYHFFINSALICFFVLVIFGYGLAYSELIPLVVCSHSLKSSMLGLRCTWLQKATCCYST
jgi:hypothetical protein